jgi:hypothetical protein
MYNILKIWNNRLKNISYNEEGWPFIPDDEFALMGFKSPKRIKVLKKFINKLWELKSISIFYNNVKNIDFWYFGDVISGRLNDIRAHIEFININNNDDTIVIYYGNSYRKNDYILTRKWGTMIYNHYILEDNWKNFKKHLLRVIRNNYYV